MNKENGMDILRKEWRDKLVMQLCKLVEPTEALHELMKEHPENLFLREDMKKVLCGNDGAGPYIPPNVSLELSRLFDILKVSRVAD